MLIWTLLTVIIHLISFTLVVWMILVCYHVSNLTSQFILLLTPKSRHFLWSPRKFVPGGLVFLHLWFGKFLILKRERYFIGLIFILICIIRWVIFWLLLCHLPIFKLSLLGRILMIFHPLILPYPRIWMLPSPLLLFSFVLMVIGLMLWLFHLLRTSIEWWWKMKMGTIKGANIVT